MYRSTLQTQINSKDYLSECRKKKNTERVPKNTNDTFIYIVSMKKDHCKNHCKRKRPWEHA